MRKEKSPTSKKMLIQVSADTYNFILDKGRMDESIGDVVARRMGVEMLADECTMQKILNLMVDARSANFAMLFDDAEIRDFAAMYGLEIPERYLEAA